MSIYKRIISLFSTFAICISLLIVPASASELVPSGQYQLTNYSRAFALGAISDLSLDYIQNIGGYLSTLWEAMKTGSCDGCSANPADGRHNFLPRDGYMITWEAGLKGNAACDCQYCGITFDEFCNSSYNQYYSALQTDLGTTTLIDGGIRIYFPITEIQPLTYATVNAATTGINWSVSFYNLDRNNGVKLLGGDPIYAPFAGTYTAGYEFYADDSRAVLEPNSTAGKWVENVSVTAGARICPNAWIDYANNCLATVTVNGKGANYFASGCFWMDFYPATGALPTEQDLSVNSRPSSIIGDYGIIGDDGTIIHVDGNMIVDESTNIVYNPVTNNTYNYTNYAFDYSDRSYNLTLEDGNTIKVMYGDENITIHEGDTIYNIYYLIPDDSGSGGGSDSGDTPSGEDMSWWKQAWISFTDKLFSILGNGGSSVNPDTAPAVPDDEETGEKGYSVIDLFVVLKDGTWAFITGIVTTAYDGFTGFVESVSSAGSFFTFYDEESEDGILFVPLEGGETIWD